MPGWQVDTQHVDAADSVSCNACRGGAELKCQNMPSLSRQVAQAGSRLGTRAVHCTGWPHTHNQASPTSVIIRHGRAQRQHHRWQLGQHLCLAIDEGSPQQASRRGPQRGCRCSTGGAGQQRNECELESRQLEKAAGKQQTTVQQAAGRLACLDLMRTCPFPQICQALLQQAGELRLHQPACGQGGTPGCEGVAVAGQLLRLVKRHRVGQLPISW